MTPNEVKNLILRCQELINWQNTGILHDGNGGLIRELADTMPAQMEHHRLNLAKDQTATDAMQFVIDHASLLLQEVVVERMARFLCYKRHVWEGTYPSDEIQARVDEKWDCYAEDARRLLAEILASEPLDISDQSLELPTSGRTP